MSNWSLNNPTVAELEAKMASPGAKIIEMEVKTNIKGAQADGHVFYDPDDYTEELFERLVLEYVTRIGAEHTQFYIGGRALKFWPWRVGVKAHLRDGAIEIRAVGGWTLVLAMSYIAITRREWPKHLGMLVTQFFSPSVREDLATSVKYRVIACFEKPPEPAPEGETP